MDVIKYEYNYNDKVKNVYYPRKNLFYKNVSTFKYTYQLDGNQIEKNSDAHDSVQYQYDALGRFFK